MINQVYEDKRGNPYFNKAKLIRNYFKKIELKKEKCL